MTTASVKTRTVELKDVSARRGIRTIYLPDATLGHDDAGNAKQARAVAFQFGRADVDEATARMLRERGLVK